PMSSQINLAVSVALEPVDVDLDLVVHDGGVVPRVECYALSSQVGRKVLGKYAGEIGVQGLGPAVLPRQFEPVRCDPGDDLLPIKVCRHLDRAESDEDLAGAYVRRVGTHRREHEKPRGVAPRPETTRDHNRAQCKD